MFNVQSDTLSDIKKDIYNQIYDCNIGINNKFQKINETLFDKLEGYDKTMQHFQHNIVVIIKIILNYRKKMIDSLLLLRTK